MRFSLVCAVRGAAAELPAFLDSVAAQTFDRALTEVVVVVDGADEASAALTHAWAQQAAGPVQVVAVTGEGSRLGAGLAVAQGEWVSFPDPVDTLAPRYLTVVHRFLTKNPAVDLVSGQQLIWDAEAGSLTRAHPLRTLYPANELVDLTASDRHFCESAIAAFFPRERLAPAEFDPAVGPTFEGGHFLARYLLGRDHPQVGFLNKARYFRRKPAAGAPSRETTVASAPRPTALFTGYADLIARARAERGEVPDWLRRQLAFEVARYLDSAQDAPAPDEDVDALHRLIAEVVTGADLGGPLATAPYYVSRQTRLLMSSGYGAEALVEGAVNLDRTDDRLGLVRARYFYVGPAPVEQVRHGNQPVEPAYGKARTVSYLDRVLLRERICWVPVHDELSFTVGDRVPPVHDQHPAPRTTPVPSTPEGLRAQKAAASWLRSREFKDAWVFTDKVHAARDNAEHLFGYVREHHRDINAFFVVEEGTRCWDRLRALHGRRVVAHGSHRWRVLMAHCTEYLSSHCDAAILTPAALLDFFEPAWRFSLLDHGVRKDDNSAWMNRRPLDLIVSTIPAETESLIGESGYVFTGKEVVQSGLPRFDRLLHLGRQTAPADRRLLLVAPTWRNWLVPGLTGGSQRRGLVAEALASDFVTAWTRLLADPELAALCERHDLDLTLLPHPNLEAMLPHLDLPAHVRTITYADTDIQQVFARTRLLVTDYSSIAFDLAYIERPLVYFQFDVERFRSGEHTFRPSYFFPEEHGFGPATRDHDETVAAIVAAVEAGPDPGAPYDARIAATFPERDGGCCARTLAGVRRGLP